MLIYNHIYILKIEPRTVHAWRQFDCLSFAQNFYNDRASLLEPCINNLGSTGTGKTASEFPIIPCITGNIWKLTGINSSIYKLINFLFLVLSLFYIYKLFYLEFKDKIISGLIAGFVFTSPLLSYYGVSTLSDMQSFSLSVTGFYFFYKWLKENKNSSFLLFLLLFSLAGLIKASAAITFIVCIFLFIHQRSIKDDLRAFLMLAIPIVSWIAWYAYVNSYNSKNIHNFFLVGLLPIWDLSSQQITDIFEKFFFNILHEVFHPALLWVLLLVIVPLSFSKLKGNLNRKVIVLCFLLFLAFIICFYGAMDIHDYYLLNPFALIVIVLFFSLKEWKEKLIEQNYKRFVIITSVLTLAFTYITGLKTWLKINDNVQSYANVIAFNAYERKNFFWIYWFDREMFKVLENHDIDLEKIGIKKDDPVFCLGDHTINRTLYLLNRRGYSNFNAGLAETPAFLKAHPEVKFLVLIDPHLKKEANLNEFLANKLFEKESLSIYRIN